MAELRASSTDTNESSGSMRAGMPAPDVEAYTRNANGNPITRSLTILAVIGMLASPALAARTTRCVMVSC
jgi:hypothetical protein